MWALPPALPALLLLAASPWAAAALAAVLLLLVRGLHVRNRLALRRCGVPVVAPVPFLLGHLAVLRKTPLHLAYQAWARARGGVFGVLLGRNAVLVVADWDAAREIMVARFRAFHDRPFIFPPPSSRLTARRLRVAGSGLLVARGAYWASLRAAVAPTFSSDALAAYAPGMGAAAGALADRLGAAAASGEAVDFHEAVGAATMRVVGEAAFSLDLGASEATAAADAAAGRPNVVAAARAIFAGSVGMPGGGAAAALLRVVPSALEPLLFQLLFATRLTAAGRRLEYARTTLMATADLLIKGAAARAAAAGRSATVRATRWRWWRDDSPYAAANPYRGAAPGAGGVVDRLVAATDKATGRGFFDYQVAAQCSTLMAAGYETTANALACAVFCLAGAPAAEAALLAELDAFGRRREVAAPDLGALPYARAVLAEALRLYPPAHMTTRLAGEDAALGGGGGGGGGGSFRGGAGSPRCASARAPFRVERGMWVHIAIFAMHRSPEYWEEPEEFRPERFVAAFTPPAGAPPGAPPPRFPERRGYLPFGLGPRNCVGLRFAEQEMVVALARLYQCFVFRLDRGKHPEGAPLALRAGITLTPAAGVWVRVLPREPAAAGEPAAA